MFSGCRIIKLAVQLGSSKSVILTNQPINQQFYNPEINKKKEIFDLNVVYLPRSTEMHTFVVSVPHSVFCPSLPVAALVAAPCFGRKALPSFSPFSPSLLPVEAVEPRFPRSLPGRPRLS